MFELIHDFIKINILTKFSEDPIKSLTSKVLKRFKIIIISEPLEKENQENTVLCISVQGLNFTTYIEHISDDIGTVKEQENKEIPHAHTIFPHLSRYSKINYPVETQNTSTAIATTITSITKMNTNNHLNNHKNTTNSKTTSPTDEHLKI